MSAAVASAVALSAAGMNAAAGTAPATVALATPALSSSAPAASALSTSALSTSALPLSTTPAVALGLAVLFAYLLGSLSGSLLLGRLRGVDIRTLGSGNAGGTNALRTQGVAFALGTVAVDIGKGALAAWLALRLLRAPLDGAGMYACVLAAVAGHVWPLFHGFRGGKGAATLVGGVAVVWPEALWLVVAVWLLSLTLSGYVGLSTVLASASLPVLALATGADPARLLFSACAATLLLYTHRANLARLRAGTESRFERVRVLGRWLGSRRG